VNRREEKKNFKLTPDDYKRLKKDPGETRTALTSSRTSFATPNLSSLYRLCLKICLPAQYLLTLQTGQGNSRQNSTWSLDNSHEPKLTHKRLYYEEQMPFKHLNNCKKTLTVLPNQPTDTGWKTSALSNRLKLSGANIGPMSKEYLKTEKSYGTGESSPLNSVDPLLLLVQTDRLCPGLGDTLVCFLHAASEWAPHILHLAGRIVVQALITNNQSEGPNETFRNLAPIAHLISLSRCLRVDQKSIPLSSLTTMK
jgi:hypothetical protein